MQIIIYAVVKYNDVRLRAEIVSKKEYSFGRGITYGVKFILGDKSDEDHYFYQELSTSWRKNKREKLRLKFKKEED